MLRISRLHNRASSMGGSRHLHSAAAIGPSGRAIVRHWGAGPCPIECSLDKLQLFGQLARVLTSHVEVAAAEQAGRQAGQSSSAACAGSLAARSGRPGAGGSSSGGSGGSSTHPVPAVLRSFTSTVAAFLPPAMVRLKRAGRRAGAGRWRGARWRPAVLPVELALICGWAMLAPQAVLGLCEPAGNCCASSCKGGCSQRLFSGALRRRLSEAIVWNPAVVCRLHSRRKAVPLGSPSCLLDASACAAVQ